MISVLCYHKILDKHDDRIKYSVHIEQFQKQIESLARQGYESISPYSLFERKHERNEKQIIISFDDGYLSDYSIAFPILKESNLSGIFFVTTNNVGSNGYVSWENLKEMDRCGMSIQSHSVSHPLLANVNADSIRKELSNSKQVIEEQLGRKVSFISFPGGSYNNRVVQLAKECNYIGAFTSRPGINNSAPQLGKFLLMNRTIITRSTTDQRFRSVVRGSQPQMAMLRMTYLLKNGIRRLIGTNTYHYVWRIFFKNTKHVILF